MHIIFLGNRNYQETGHQKKKSITLLEPRNKNTVAEIVTFYLYKSSWVKITIEAIWFKV